MPIFFGIVLFFCPLLASPAESFSFAVVGDNPYGDANVSKYERLIDQVNSTGDIKWVIHLGDVKAGQEDCSDKELLRRFNLNQKFDTHTHKSAHPKKPTRKTTGPMRVQHTTS